MKLGYRIVTIILFFFITTVMFAQKHDLEIMVSANKDSAKIGEDIVYVVRIRNANKTNVSGVTVRIWNSPGLKYLSNTAPAGTSYNPNALLWSVGSVKSTQNYITLFLRYQVTQDGVQSLFGEIQSMTEIDDDSTPANNLFQEDDIQLKSVSIPMDFCLGEKIYITCRGALGFAQYQWYKDGFLVKDSTSRTFTITEPGVYRYTVNGAVLGGCQGELCAPIIVRYRSGATLNIAEPTAACGAKSIDLTQHINATPSNGTYSFYRTYSDARNNLNPLTNNVVKNITTSGNYFVKYTINGGCGVIDTFKAVVLPEVLAVANSPRAVTCASSVVALNSNGSTSGATITYNWSGPNNFTSTNPAPVVSAAGIYSLTVSNTATGCSAIDTAVVRNNNYAVKVFAGNDTTIVKGKSVALDAKATGGVAPYKYRWLPPVGLTNANIKNPIATPQATTTYNLIVTDANGCQGGDLIKITVTAALVEGSNKNIYTMICESGNGLPALNLNMRLKGDTTGGIWSVESGDTKTQFDATTGIFNPNGLATGTYIFKYTIADGPNEIISEEEITINIEQCLTKVVYPTTVIKN
jgi:uncharacterized repeat protein (TIGR01451 family)